VVVVVGVLLRGYLHRSAVLATQFMLGQMFACMLAQSPNTVHRGHERHPAVPPTAVCTLAQPHNAALWPRRPRCRPTACEHACAARIMRRCAVLNRLRGDHAPSA
jgi:hypothetical protein